MRTVTQPVPTPQNLIDYEQLATWLSDSIRHLRRLVHEDRIPYVKVGHFVRFDPNQIRHWLDENRHGRPE